MNQTETLPIDEATPLGIGFEDLLDSSPAMTEKEKSEREKYAENIASGKAQFRIPEDLAHILGAGNEAGYADYKAGKPAREFDAETSDEIFVRGYKAGYRMASKGKKPQTVVLKEMGFAELSND